MRIPPVSILTAALVAAVGCATARVENPPLERYEAGSGYGANFIDTPYAKKLRVVLAFSGGGTRASALAYGVLKELRDTEIVLSGQKVRLLDTISTISSVSGGSFTSAYYGLHGERIFEDYEERFLRKDIDARLAFNLFRPFDLLRFAFTRYTRSDMAMDLYDRELFDGATFADLKKKGGPLLLINSTDIDIGVVWTFIQPSFDLICGDVSKMRVSTAVTASSAVPGVFAPLVLENRAGTCNHPEPAWIEEALAEPAKSRRRYHEARGVVTYLDREERPYIFLVDGGVADNVGARRILADVIESGGVMSLAQGRRLDLPEHVVYIVVNAQAGGSSRLGPDPGAALNGLGAELDHQRRDVPLQLRDDRAAAGRDRELVEAGRAARHDHENFGRRGGLRQPRRPEGAAVLQRRRDELQPRRQNDRPSDRGRWPAPARVAGLPEVPEFREVRES